MSAPPSPRPDGLAPKRRTSNENGADPDRLLTADDVAEILQVPRTWVYAQSRDGDLPTVRLGRYYRYRRPDVLAWVEGRKRMKRPLRSQTASGIAGNVSQRCPRG